MNAIIYESALSHTLRSDASEKREEKSVSTFERFRLWTSLESSPVSVKSRKTAQPLEVNLKWSNMKLQTKFGPNGPSFRPVPYNVNMMAMLGKKQELERATILTEIPHKSVRA